MITGRGTLILRNLHEREWMALIFLEIHMDPIALNKPPLTLPWKKLVILMVSHV